MPRPVSHQGRTGYPWELAEAWTGHHTPVVSRTFTVTAQVREQDQPGAVDQVTHRRTRVPGAVLWQGPCRLQQIGDDTTAEVAGQQVTTRRYELSIAWAFDHLDLGLQVSFPDAQDPQLADATLTVVEFHLGTLRWSTVLICEHNAG